MYKRFVKQSEFKKYLHGFCDAGTRLLFKFTSGTHGLNEELGRHRGREGKVECSICGAECECGSCVVGVSSICDRPHEKGPKVGETNYEI